MNGPSRITLAIESAIAGGSLSLLRDGVEILSWAGTSSLSKAEDLLVNIDLLLSEAAIPPSEIDLIAVSAGPGSFTGIRIGIATALGLKNGLGIAMASESVLKAVSAVQPDAAELLVALPVGRNAVCLQRFSKSGRDLTARDEPDTITENEFFYLQPDTKIAAHADLFEKMRDRGNAVNLGRNLASAVGRICYENPNVVAKPLFISKSF